MKNNPLKRLFYWHLRNKMNLLSRLAENFGDKLETRRGVLRQEQEGGEIPDRVLEILQEYKEYSLGKIEQILEKTFEKEHELSAELKDKWKDFSDIISYERVYCNELGVNYNYFSRGDRLRIEAAALKLAEGYS